MQFLSKAIVFYWATTTLVASTCFGADVHYCEGKVQTFAVFDVAKPCKMHQKQTVKVAEKELPPCCKARKKAEKKAKEGVPVFKKGKCCHNDQVAFKTDGQIQKSSVDLPSVELKTPAFVPSQNEIVFTSALQNTNTPFRGPPDPDLRHNYQIFFQVFRI
ncbi:MAG: hypothetical protein ACFHU9_10780 [Fluviicola sp.]